MIEEGKVSNSNASSKIIPLMISSKESPKDIAIKYNLIIEDNKDEIKKFIDDTLKKYPKKVEEYKNGKKGLIGLFMGEVMKLSKGKADPKKTNQLLVKELEKKFE